MNVIIALMCIVFGIVLFLYSKHIEREHKEDIKKAKEKAENTGKEKAYKKLADHIYEGIDGVNQLPQGIKEKIKKGILDSIIDGQSSIIKIPMNQLPKSIPGIEIYDAGTYPNIGLTYRNPSLTYEELHNNYVVFMTTTFSKSTDARFEKS